MVNGEVWMFIQ